MARGAVEAGPDMRRTTVSLSKVQIGTVVEILGFVALAVGAVLSLRHLAIALCVVGGAAAAYVGNRIRVGG
jgi:hypothetical protein